MLDLNTSLALGYNYESFMWDRMVPGKYDRFLQGKIDCSSLPPSDYVDLLREVVMPVAPSGMTQVHLSDGRVSSANDAAISVALFAYAVKHDSANYKQLSVLGFENSSHGYSIAGLSCSDASTNKNNCPTFKWPIAPLPKLKYPLA